MSTTKILIIAGIVAIVGFYILKPKDESLAAETKKLTDPEREAILKAVLAAGELAADGDGKFNLRDYDLITDAELISIKKMMDAEKKSGKLLIKGNEFDAYLAKKGGDSVIDEQGVLDLAKVNDDFEKRVSDKQGLSNKLAEYKLSVADMKTAFPASVKIGLIAQKGQIEKKTGKKLTVINSMEKKHTVKPFQKKTGTTEKPQIFIKKGMPHPGNKIKIKGGLGQNNNKKNVKFRNFEDEDTEIFTEQFN